MAAAVPGRAATASRLNIARKTTRMRPSAVDRVIPLMGLTPPNDETLMAAYVRAFEKVFSQLERVVA